MSVILQELIEKSEYILDIGAGCGEYSAIYSEINSEASIYAFESSSIMYQLLLKNLHDNVIKNVTALNYAIGHKVAMARLQKKDELVNVGGLYVRKIDDEEVQMITIDSLNLTHCDFIRIDGVEEYILLGAHNTISKFKPAILYKDSNSTLYLTNHGYKISNISEGYIAIYEHILDNII